MGSKLKDLQEWCKIHCEGYKDVSITNMTTSWRDGLAFCALIHRFHPELINFDTLSKENIYENNKLAFDTASKLGISPFLDPEDMVNMKIPDKLSIITYVSQYYNIFRKESINNKSSISLKRTTTENDTDIDNESKKKQLQSSPLFVNSVASDAYCLICKKKVYLMERFTYDNQLYHRDCYRKNERNDYKKSDDGNNESCNNINKNVDSDNLKRDSITRNPSLKTDTLESNDEVRLSSKDKIIHEISGTDSDLQYFKDVIKKKMSKVIAPPPPAKIENDFKESVNQPRNHNTNQTKENIKKDIAHMTEVKNNEFETTQSERQNCDKTKATTSIQRSVSMFIKTNTQSPTELSKFPVKSDINSKKSILNEGSSNIERESKSISNVQTSPVDSSNIFEKKASIDIKNKEFIDSGSEINCLEIRKPIKIPERPKREMPPHPPVDQLSTAGPTINEIELDKPKMRNNPNPIPKPRRSTVLITNKELKLLDDERSRTENTNCNNANFNAPLPTPRNSKTSLTLKISNKLSDVSNNKSTNIKSPITEKIIPRRPPPPNVVIHTPTDNDKSLSQNTSNTDTGKVLLSPKNSISKSTPPPRPIAPPNLNTRKKLIPNFKFDFFDDINLDSNENQTDEMLLKKHMADKMLHIDSRLQQLEVEGRSLELKIRECDITMEDSYLSRWFDLISQRNDLLREEADLIYSYKHHELEILQANIEAKKKKVPTATLR